LEALFKGGQGSTSGCCAEEEEEGGGGGEEEEGGRRRRRMFRTSLGKACKIIEVKEKISHAVLVPSKICVKLWTLVIFNKELVEITVEGTNRYTRQFWWE
jgi:hypothetical protein